MKKLRICSKMKFETQIVSIILLLCLIVVEYVSSADNSTLILLQIVHRHGDRTPISLYKNDPYGKDKWVDGLGELTPNGKRRMYWFGKQLRQRYDRFLGESPKNIAIRSSSSDRCLESAAALSTGLYPPHDRWVWSKDLVLATFWQPIAIQTVLKSSDGLLVPNSYCPAADAAYEETMRSKQVQDFMASQKDFIEKVEQKSGQNLTTLRQVDYLYDTILAETTFDEPKPVPQWVIELGNNTLDRLRQFQLNAFKWDWSSRTVQKLRGGLLLQELTNNMKNAAEGKLDIKKVYSYSTHDTLIVTLLQAMDLYSGIPVSYGSSLLFELHKINGQHFVHFFYANVTPVLTYSEIGLKNCRLSPSESFCELNRFVKSVSQLIPDDWEKECQIEVRTMAVFGDVEESGDDLNRHNYGMSKRKSKKSAKNKSESLLLFFIGVLTGISTLLVMKLIKWLLDKSYNQMPNRIRYMDNSYSVNTLYKTEDVYKI